MSAMVETPAELCVVPDQSTEPKQNRSSQQDGLKKVRQALASSSLNGFSHVASASSRLTMFFWSLILIGGLIGFTFNLSGLVQRYAQGPVSQTYLPDHVNFIWPDITICNPVNPLPFWGLTPAIQELWNSTLERTVKYGKTLYKNGFTIRFTHQLAMSTLNPEVIQLRKLEKILFDLKYNDATSGESIFMSYTYTDADLYRDMLYLRTIPYKYQVPCITYNVGGINNSTKLRANADNIESIKMLILADSYSYQIFNADFDNRKVSVFISSPNHTVPQMKQHFQLPGTEGVFRISMTHAKRLTDTDTCVKDPFQIEVYDAMLERTRTFYGSYDDCKMYVKQMEILKRCKCYSHDYPVFKSDQFPPRFCMNMSIFSPNQVARNMLCNKEALWFLHQNSKMKIECSRYLKPLCNQYIYDVAHDSVAWNDDFNENRRNFLSALAMSLPVGHRTWRDPNFLGKNAVFLNIQRKHELADLLIEEYTYGFSQFLSDVGGISGLWMGLSVISMFEFISVGIIACRAYYL